MLRVACFTSLLCLLPAAAHAELSDTCFGYEATFPEGDITGTIHFHAGNTAIVSTDGSEELYQGIWSQTPANSPINSIFSRWSIELPGGGGTHMLHGVVLFDTLLIGTWTDTSQNIAGDLFGFVEDCGPAPPAPRP